MKKENRNMTIVSPSKPLADLATWKKAFIAIDKNPRHWKEGRNACSLARYFLSGRGEPEIVSALNAVERVVDPQ